MENAAYRWYNKRNGLFESAFPGTAERSEVYDVNSEKGLQRHLSPAGAWAFSVGTSIGWGSLVVTASTYLNQAGPLGSLLGLAAGAIVMLMIGWSYAYMIQCYPESGGAYAFTREVFGYDQAFLAAWFLAMTYFAILWANATSLPLFGRIFLGGVFRFGKLYTIFGYDVYLGEALLSMAAMVLAGLLLTRFKKAANRLMIVLVSLFSVCILIVFIGAMTGESGGLEPAYVPDSSALSQIVHIAVISPWAFIGFECVSHGTEEFAFDRKKTRKVLLISVVTTLALYGMITLLSVTAYPPEYENWLAYIKDLDHLEGLKALPAFYVADRYMGSFGVTLLMLSLLSLVLTSLIGNTVTLSRLAYALAKDRILPARFAEVNDRGIPASAVLLVVGFSFFVPLVGRTAIGWIVDVTTIGATLIYSFVSAAAAKSAKKVGDRREMWVGRVSLIVMVGFGLYILLPNLVEKGSLMKETYFLFIVWSVLGFVLFRWILRRDKEKRFGASIVVWVAIMALVLFISLIWMRQSMIASNEHMMANIQEYYSHADADGQRREDALFIADQVDIVQAENTRTILLATGMFAFALAIMLTNHSYLNKRSQESERLAIIDPLTGVKNKHAYLTEQSKLDAAIAEKRGQEFAIVVCDVNNLKKVNDTLGHKAGDEYIRDACRMVCEIFQHSPVYRVGGDEFVAILRGRDYLIRRELMIALHERSADHIRSGGTVVSGGLSEYDPETDTSAHDVFERADQLMYEEKKLLKGLDSAAKEDADGGEAQFLMEINQDDAILNVKRHVLIAEDEIISRLMLGDSLENDYEILYASDGLEALEQIMLHKNDLALVMLDLQMPRMSGVEVLKTLKSEPDTQNIPILVLTSDRSMEASCLRMGAVDFISKPYPAAEIILARVNKCIELSETREIIQSTARDSLTNLFNIDYFLRYVNLFDQHYRDKAMDAIVLDVNHFHMINERYGRQYGNSVLRGIGERIRAIAREVGGVGCRQGADTFLIYCPHLEDYTDLLEKASAGAGDGENASNRVRMRLGVYACVDKTLDIEHRFDYAKAAADSVKNSYIKSIGVYDAEMHRAELFKNRLVEDFRPSIEQERFLVYYQPKFDIRPERPLLCSAEALVRWDHPDFGLIGPGKFIPILEENGLILELDKYVWRRVANQIRAWKEQFGFSVPVSVNVSRIDTLTPDLKAIFLDILKSCRLTVDDMALEITESAYAEDSEQVISSVKELRGMGFRIEMDDFGTGYSSLGMLTNLPIVALKLDMSFIQSAFGEKRDMRLIEMVIDIADYLHIPVVAEGVETEEQYLALKAMGCDLVQGFYFSKPVPPQAFARFLIERAQQAMEAPREAAAADMSFPKMLTSDFERIFYIDLLTGHYLEFFTDSMGGFEILPDGRDFFRDMQEKLLKDVAEKDKEAVSDALTRDSLKSWAGRDEKFSLSFRSVGSGREKRYSLQTIQTRNGGGRHIAVGIRPEEESSI